MASGDSVTLACGCVITASDQGAKLTPVCAAHLADPTALALLASQDPVVQALAQSATPAPDPTAATYSGAPNSSPRDRVRFMIGDTNVTKAMFTDGEIDAMLDDFGDDPLLTALSLVDALVARFSGAIDETVGSVSMAFSQKADGFRRLADTLRARLARRAVPYAGGISRTDKMRQAMDPDRVQPMFRRGQFASYRWLGDSLYLAGAGGEYWLRWGSAPVAVLVQ